MFEGTVDGSTIVAEIEMLRTLRNHAVLVVEGPSDVKFLANFIDERQCDIVIAWGSDNSLEALKIARTRWIKGLCCVIDRDYREFLCLMFDDPDVVFTDEHDIEMMMVRSQAFTKVLSEMGSRAKIREEQRKYGDLAEFVCGAVHIVGVLRLYALEKRKALKFEALRYGFVDHRTLTVDIAGMLKEVCNHSRIPIAEVGDYEEYLRTWREREHNRWMMCCGHDFTAIMGKSLRSLLGTRNAGEVTGEELESRLRLAFGEDAFTRTALAGSIRAWELNNSPYKCVSDRVAE